MTEPAVAEAAGALPPPRPMRSDEVIAVDALATRAFDDLAARLALDEPARGERTDAEVARSLARFRHLQAHHGDGAWVVDHPDGDGLAAAALALRHGAFWGLSLLVVDPAVQGRGAGWAALAAGLRSAAGSDRRLIASSPDPPALRAYARAGFALHPGLRVVGRTDRARIPTGADAGVREGDAADRDLVDDLDVRHRGAPHGADLDVLLANGGRLLVVERGGHRGYAVMARNAVGLLAADDVDCARALVWRIAADATPEQDTGVGFACGAHQWLVDVAVQAGWTIKVQGALCTVGFDPPASYLPSGAYL